MSSFSCSRGVRCMISRVRHFGVRWQSGAATPLWIRDLSYSSFASRGFSSKAPSTLRSAGALQNSSVDLSRQYGLAIVQKQFCGAPKIGQTVGYLHATRAEGPHDNPMRAERTNTPNY